MNLQHSRAKEGATLVEMLAAIVILSLVVIGVMQYILVSRLNLYTSNVRAGVMQTLSDTIVKYQSMPVGITNLDATILNPDIAPYIYNPADRSGPGFIKIEKTGPNNGVYTVTGSLTWKAFPNGDGSFAELPERLSLEIPQ